MLDSQAEGFFRVWHYGAVFVIDASGIRLGAGWVKEPIRHLDGVLRSD